ncbi:probable plastid-lipid-associated protein 13, chloroplastic [Primulina huaijiensis]|uniref:probable plastid-lipid-associated protein 13, chloroplastic n=1 Tax=Primulina huaijiensis TaxID=1492673 RepID=UPI003CC718FC
MAGSISIQSLLVSPRMLSPNMSSSPPLRSSTPLLFLEIKNHGSCLKLQNGKRRISRKCRAMVSQTSQGPSAAYAKEMERLAAKESLLLAFRDAGGFEALVTGKISDMQRIDVNERIVGLEGLNPTPRPTTSPYLEGQWKYEWFGSGSPGLLAARIVFERFPSALANLSRLDVSIKDGYAKITANLKFLNSVESNFILNSKLSVEGPLRMKEEYIEGIIESPKIIEDSIPQQLKGAFDQAASTVQQLPVSIRDAAMGGFKVPLGGTFQRLFLISYLDDEIMIARSTAGFPEVLTRLDPGPSVAVELITEYES